MSPLVYLVRKGLKNTALDILRNPGKLALWLIMTAAVLLIAVTSIFTRSERARDAIIPLFWFTGVLFLFITLLATVSVLKGLSGGNTMFEMNDVNLLFNSPINPRKILLYGVVKMAAAAFFAGFFILFQTTSLGYFGLDYSGVLLTFAGTILSLMTLTVASLVIYSETHSSPRRKLAVKLMASALFMPLTASAVIQYFTTKNLLMTMETVIQSPFLRFVPVAGWTAGGVTAFISGHIAEGFCWFGADALLMCGMTVYILLSNPDYYENVLVAAETAYEKNRAAAAGNFNSVAAAKKRVRITKTGIPGLGASAIFGKHTRESFRENRLGFLTLPSVLTVAGAIIFAALSGDILTLLFVLPWIQIVLIGTGRGLKDLYSHYIYMIPESSFKKIIWSNMEIMARTLIENVLMFVIAGLIARADILSVAVCVVVYTLFSYLLLSVNYVIMRFTGADVSSGALLLIYYLAVILVMIPGIAATAAVSLFAGGAAGFVLELTVLAAWELLAGTAGFALSKGVLHDCDMAMIKINK
ncbi:MAG: putative ABC exporter domain-containing protein [Peptococcaceae bacterium]|jgi:hypothetical protein|nr:putative ABC exporter domain-containing protein [Peptococcaceae bacterium]